MTKTNEIKTHWVADLYSFSQEDVEYIAESIKESGQTNPILALKDGTIIDGRHRWHACQLAGVEPRMKIINPGGEEFSDEELCQLSISSNSMRRDASTSQRACAAAQSWKLLYPDGAPKSGRPSKSNPKNEVIKYADFAKSKFKVSKTYAEQAQAILNQSPGLFEDAKVDLSGNYKTHQERLAEQREKRRKMAVLDRAENADIKTKLGNGLLNLEEALVIVIARNEEQEQRLKEEERRVDSTMRTLSTIANLHRFRPSTAKEAFSRMNKEEGFAENFAKGIETLRSHLEPS